MEINSVFGRLNSDLYLLLSDAIEAVEYPERYSERSSKERNKNLRDGDNHFRAVFKDGKIYHQGNIPVPELHSCYGSIYLMKDMDTINTYIDYIKGRLSFDYMLEDPHEGLNRDGSINPYYDNDHRSLFSINVIDCKKDIFERLKYGPCENSDGSITVGYYLESGNKASILNQPCGDVAEEVANMSHINVDLNIFVNFEANPLSSVLSLIYTKQMSVNVIFAVSEAFDKLNISCPWDLVRPIDVEDQYRYSKENVDDMLKEAMDFAKMCWESLSNG